MFKIGDKIVYPMHGAGVIEAIEEKEILGTRQQYYVMRLPIGEMKVMIPLQNVDEIGVRSVINPEQAESVMLHFKTAETTTTSNWNKRYRENMIKIKSGDISEVAIVVKNLMLRERDKGLSTGERKMLCNAKQIFMSELLLAKQMEQEGLENMLDSYLMECE